LQAAKHVGAAPAGLRSAGDLAVVSRFRIEVERAEAADAERGEALLRTPLRQDLRQAAERLVGRGRRHRLARNNSVGAARKNGDAFGAAKLDSGISRHASALSGCAAQQPWMNSACIGRPSTRCLIAARMRAR